MSSSQVGTSSSGQCLPASVAVILSSQRSLPGIVPCEIVQVKHAHGLTDQLLLAVPPASGVLPIVENASRFTRTKKRREGSQRTPPKDHTDLQTSERFHREYNSTACLFFTYITSFE